MSNNEDHSKYHEWARKVTNDMRLICVFDRYNNHLMDIGEPTISFEEFKILEERFQNEVK